MVLDISSLDQCSWSFFYESAEDAFLDSSVNIHFHRHPRGAAVLTGTGLRCSLFSKNWLLSR